MAEVDAGPTIGEELKVIESTGVSLIQKANSLYTGWLQARQLLGKLLTSLLRRYASSCFERFPTGLHGWMTFSSSTAREVLLRRSTARSSMD